MQTPLNNDKATAGTATLPEQVNKSSRTSSPLFIVTDSDQQQQSKRRAEALAAAYRYILSDAWGQHE
jgi:hypothetical protein